MASTTTTPPTRATSSLSGTGTGGGPAPVTPGAKTRSATSSRRASLQPTRTNGSSSPSPGSSPLAGKAGDVEVAKMTRDQMQALIISERRALDEGRRKRDEAEEALAKALEEGEEQERRRVTLEARLEEKEKDVARFEQEVAKRVAEADQWQVQAKELDRTRVQVKDADRRAREQAEAFESERTTWLDRERHLKSRIASLSKDVPSPARRLTDLPEEPEGADEVRTRSRRADSGSSAGGVSVVVSDSPERPRSTASDVTAEQQAECHIQFRRSPSLRPGRAHVPKELKVPSSPAGSTTSLNVTPATPRHNGGGSTLPGVPLPPEMLAELSELRGLVTAHEALQSELADLKRVNAQLMEENESYELLVGEKTLAGQLDLKSLLRQSTYGSSEADGEEASDSFSTLNTSIATSQLDDVKEEEAEDEVERMILESQGSGSRTTGAVEAQTAPKKKPRAPAPASTGLGLDLAAELEKAQVEEQEELRERSPKKHAKPSAEVAALRAELRALQDANKALALYISKIIDRIVGMDGFEKVLSADYTKPDAPAKVAAPKAGAEKPTKRMTLDWRTLSPTSLFGGGGAQTKPAPQAPPVVPGLKPLTLTGQKAGGADDEEDAKERERLRAEMKLHGLENAGSPQLHAGFRESPALGIEQTLETASEKGGLASSLKASIGGQASTASSTPIQGNEGGPSALKREEEREREIKANLDRGAAGGFTEISRTRRRPSLKDRDRAVSGNSIRSSASTPSNRSRPVSPMLPPLPDELPATADAGEPAAAQSVFTRAAKRLSMSWGPRPDARPADLPTSPS